MSTVFEDRSTHGEADPVATITLTVDCDPGQVSHLTNFLIGVSAKAGVYTVAVDHTVAIHEVQGEAHGEQPIQHADPDHPGEDLGREGSFTAEGGATAIVAERVEPELAGAPWESGTGPSGGDA